MKNGLAIWHYPHRTLFENITFFSQKGFDAVSIHGADFVKAISDEASGEKLAAVIEAANVTVTVHHCLPVSHTPADVAAFQKDIRLIDDWLQKHPLLSVLSFDVPDVIRDHITAYVDYVLDQTNGVRIAVEDFGLNADERSQISHLSGNDRFGILIDIGHMYIRLRGRNTLGLTLFTNSTEECAQTDAPSQKEFLKALRHVPFPILEVHLHNNDGEDDLHYFLEDGTCEIAEVAAALREIGFDGVLTIESAPGYRFPCAGAEADARILNTYEYWKKLFFPCSPADSMIK